MRKPCSPRWVTTVLRSSSESASLKRWSVSGKCWPMSPRPAAPSSASMIACVRTSASEWPARPSSCGMSTPPRISGRPGSKRWLSTPRPVRITSSPASPVLAEASHSTDRLQAPLPALEDAQLGDPELAEQLDRLVVAVPEVVGTMGVARERDRQAGVDDHLEEAAGRVDLPDGLAQAG